ncbi:MAG TPA: accessory factor UbiK family protein, partial [Paracoccus sp. (in: a-proteobacteria)]|nr:accessory factor UbiK family protein [Paracoccus sp. (in: a-proteobacteria)]
MTANNRFFDDLSKLMTNAMGVAQGAKDEAQTAFNGWIDRWLAERDFVTREEFEAVREMAIKARTENTELRARLGAFGGRRRGRRRAAGGHSHAHRPDPADL